MFKLIALFAIVAVVSARPGLLGAQTSLETIGSVVNNVPTAITHQSQTQIHTQPIISSIVSPVIRQIAVPSIIQGSILSSPILSSQILLGQQRQLLSGSVIGEQALLSNDQASIVGDQGSLIGGEGLLLRGNSGLTGVSIDDQTRLVSGSGLLRDSIDISNLKLKGLRQ